MHPGCLEIFIPTIDMYQLSRALDKKKKKEKESFCGVSGDLSLDG